VDTFRFDSLIEPCGLFALGMTHEAIFERFSVATTYSDQVSFEIFIFLAVYLIFA